MLQSISDSDLDKFILPVLYRPFDVRWIFYHDSVVWRTVKEIMRHMMRGNLGIITSRQMDKSGVLPVFVTDLIIDAHSITSAVSISTLFPLYLYPSASKNTLFEERGKASEKTPNLNPVLFEKLTESYGVRPSPEEIFYYIYAILYSNLYRKKYAGFLKTDFPKIPFTKNYRLFIKISEYGKRLVDLHLLRSRELTPLIVRFQGEGDDNKIKKLKYDEKEKRVYINENKYFEGVENEVWEYQIGGYQICSKWLKDRKDKKLSLDEIIHYCKIVTSLQKTIEIQREIDDIYPQAEKEIIEFENR